MRRAPLEEGQWADLKQAFIQEEALAINKAEDYFIAQAKAATEARKANEALALRRDAEQNSVRVRNKTTPGRAFTPPDDARRLRPSGVGNHVDALRAPSPNAFGAKR